MAKYKVGDKVRVRSDLKLHKRYFMEDDKTADSFVEDMKQWSGKVVTIESCETKYRIKEAGFNWTDEMFEGLAEEQQFHVFDTVKHEKYGLGTIVCLGNGTVDVDFDEFPFDKPYLENNVLHCLLKNLTLVKAYSPN